MRRIAFVLALCAASAIAQRSEITTKPLRRGDIYQSKALSALIVSDPSREAPGFMVVVSSAVLADYAIVEVAYREPVELNGHAIRVYRVMKQVVPVMRGVPIGSDYFLVDLDKVVKITVQLASVSHEAEFLAP